ncbi:Rv2407 family type 3 sulfatase [Anaerolineales bacterium]
MSPTTQLLILGSGTPNCQPGRYFPALAIIVNDQAYFVDCGGGCLQRIATAHASLHLPALAFPRLNRLFLTHLHPDHTTGLADFMIAPWVLDRDNCQIYGPPGTADLCHHLLLAYETGIAEHRDGLVPIHHPLALDIHEIEAGLCYQDHQLKVFAIPATHGGLKAFSYRFETPDRSIVVSGDTAPNTRLLKAAQGCDWLVHEVYSARQLEKRSPDWQTYHRAVHTSTIELAELANQVQPQKLILMHQLYWGISDEELIAEIQAHYPGPIFSAQDLDLF